MMGLDRLEDRIFRPAIIWKNLPPSSVIQAALACSNTLKFQSTKASYRRETFYKELFL
jgi:hypothetical protein